MMAIDELAYASPFRSWSPLGKFLVALVLLISALMASSVVVPIIGFIIGFVLLAISTRFKFPRIIIFAILEGVLIILLGAIVIAFVTAGEPLWDLDLGLFVLHFSRQGVDLGLMIFFRAVAGIAVMLFFATSTPIPYLTNALRQIRVPKEIIELTMLIYRYSFLLLEQLEIMNLAAHCRLGFRGYRNKFRTTARLTVGIFTRSLDMAERSQVALNCRCFRGEFNCYRPPAKVTVRWILASIILFEAMNIVNLIILDPGLLSVAFQM